MKKYWLIVLALTLVTAMFANRYEVVAWQEDFESGATGWTHWDGTQSPSMWHIYNADATQGDVWWMGDPALASGANIGGYYNHQYLVLDTPARTLTAGNANLTFKMRLGLEEPGTSTTNPEYNGWDSFNVRISTDGGNVWTTINPTNPAYHFTSSFAFGQEHGEGVNIPGWGGMLTTWTQASFNLSAYVGQSVQIRFAFASDPAYATAEQPNMFGAMVDDIVFADYTNNGVNDGQMTFSSMVPLGGDIWNLVEVAGAPSPSHVFRNQNAQNTYNTNMLNYLQSPVITLPASGAIWADFQIMGDFSDPDAWPNVDYWGWEISPDNGTTWYYMSNPYGTTGVPNYVYSDAPDVWSSAIESYTLDGLITNYAGMNVIFRWYFQSDFDDPIGTGIMIDNFKIYNDVPIAAPENLTATVSGSSVTLVWEEPGGEEPPPPAGFTDDFESYNDFALTFAPWTLVDVDMSATYGFTGITFPNSGSPMAYMIFNPSATTPATTSADAHSGSKYAACFASTTPSNNDWLISPVITPAAGQFLNFWARSYVSTYGLERFKVGISTTGTAPANFTIISGANYVQAPVAWTQYSYDLSAYVGQEIRFGIQCVSDDAFIFFVDDVSVGAPATRFDSPAIAQTEGNAASRALVAPGSAPLYDVNGVPSTRTVSSYKIYRNQTYVATVPNGVLTYTENDVPGGAHVYHVTAMYDQNESPASNAISVFVMPGQHGETYYDDGTAELGLTLGANRQMAVKHNYGTWINVKYAKVYVHTVGTAGIIIRVFDNDGPDGMPGTNPVVQFQYPAASIVQGWNYIPIPQDAVFDDGIFYIGILETAGASQIGVDSSAFGHSYTRISNWEPYNTGEIMIRAIVFTGSDNEDDLNPALTLAASNYPNPFNPETTISYSVPKNGVTSLKVYNTKGQMVRSLVNKDLTAGMHQVVWNGTDDKGKSVPSGVYFYRVENAGKAVTKKMLLSK